MSLRLSLGDIIAIGWARSAAGLDRVSAWQRRRVLIWNTRSAGCDGPKHRTAAPGAQRRVRACGPYWLIAQVTGQEETPGVFSITGDCSHCPSRGHRQESSMWP